MSESSLATKACAACEKGAPPLTPAEREQLMSRLKTPWEVVENGKKIRREFKFADFKGAMKFINKIAVVANQESHHPDLFIYYNIIKVELWTHNVGGLSENDFIMAAKIEQIEV